jgi:hypothetical protein
MVDTIAGGELPTPAQMQTFHEVARAVQSARRMREASRAVITGNVAFVFCLVGAVLVVTHSRWGGSAGPFVIVGLMFGYFAGLILSLQWMKRQRARSLVTVVDRREEEARAAVARPWRATAVVLGFVVFQAASAIGWSVAFRHMSNAGILASLSLGPIIGMLFFVRRFVVYRFWEDVLFATCVALAYAPLFFRTRDVSLLSALALVLVVLGTASLHARWVAWTRTLADAESDDAPEEVRP